MTDVLRVLIVDDERPARQRLQNLLKRDARVELLRSCASGSEALHAAEEAERAGRPVHVLFLDVQMPELDGFGVVSKLVEQRGAENLPVVVFVTAHDEYALRAFEAHAIDYLLKPFTRERLLDAVAHVRHGWQSEHRTADPRLLALLEELRERPRFLQRLPVRAGPRVVLLETGEIDWLQAADNYVLVHASGREYLLRETLTRLEQELDPQQFVRIHRSAMVRLDRIGDLLPSVHGDFRVTLKTGVQLTLSRYYREHVERVLRRAL